MPLLDHFHPPLSETRKWEGFHSHWTSSLAAQLNAGLLPPHHFAEPQVSHGRIEVDVAADRLPGNGAAPGLASASSGGVATLAAPVWSPPAPTLEMDAVFAAEFTVLVINIEAGPTFVGAIELVSPSNKARPAARRAFAMKCLNDLNAGIGLIIVDVVTHRRANLHDQMARLMVGNAPRFPGGPSTYAAAYRPFRRGDEEKVSVWPVTLTVGGPLPVLPLWLREVEEPVRVARSRLHRGTSARRPRVTARVAALAMPERRRFGRPGSYVNSPFRSCGEAPSDQPAPDGRPPGMAASTLDIQPEAC
jgi:hypothetical protein